MKRGISILVIVIVLILMMMPTAALAYDFGGLTYNDNDFGKLQAFLNLTSSDGSHTNGWQLNPAYDPNDPATWTGVTWNAVAEKRVIQINVDNKSLAGALDISGCTALANVLCGSNAITSLNAGGCTALTSLQCYDNNLTSLNVSDSTALTVLACRDNALTALDVSANTLLTMLICDSNELTALNLSNNTQLEMLGCCFNKLTALDVSNNTLLTSLSCSDNELAALDLGTNALLTQVYCNTNVLTSLNTAGCPLLNRLDCYQNELASLNLGANTQLTVLFCNINKLTALDLSANTLLTELGCNENELTTLDVRANTALIGLGCSYNPLTSILASIGGNIRLSAEGGGYVSLRYDGNGLFAQSEYSEHVSFYEWRQGGESFDTSPAYELTPGEDYDLTAHYDVPLTFEGVPKDGTMYVGGRCTVTPSPAGGKWYYDEDYFSVRVTDTGAVFTALKEGKSIVTYILGAQVMQKEITIKKTELPQTGQDFSWVMILGGIAAILCGMAAIMGMKKAAMRK